ncbi:centromere/kinetochore protein zw10 homolog isoform X2 [Vicia villosa]|nr:centromere/kinetochore protein zw10 homolog isoform X2 [Vicia villosa]
MHNDCLYLFQEILGFAFEAIDSADGFQNTHQMQQYESAKFSIDQVVFILQKVHIIWEPFLLPSTYRKSMCTVLESVFSRISRDILLLDDIAANETLQDKFEQKKLEISSQKPTIPGEDEADSQPTNEMPPDLDIWVIGYLVLEPHLRLWFLYQKTLKSFK